MFIVTNLPQKCESFKNVEAGGIENYLALELWHIILSFRLPHPSPIFSQSDSMMQKQASELQELTLLLDPSLVKPRSDALDAEAEEEMAVRGEGCGQTHP